MDLVNKTAIVTGGGRGIGKATAIALADANCHVAICSRTNKELKETEKQIGNKFCLAKRCDVRNPKDVRSFVQAVAKKYKSIDILINNAGIGYYKTLLETKEKEFDDTMSTNVKGIFNFCKEVVPNMLKNGSGMIINISSGSGKIGRRQISAYSASKFAVIGFTESLADELAPHIVVYAICPDSVDTKMYYDIFKEHPALKPDEVAKKIIEVIKSEPTSGSSIDVSAV